jgi:GT2 family glycosyltransferase
MQIDNPMVSILILNWNGEKVIRKSLESIRKLTYLNREEIVVDNNSTDDSIAIIRKEFPEFQLLKNKANLGFAAGMNEGIRKATGDLILLYNNDAIAHPKSLSILVERAMSDDSIGLVGGLILFFRPDNVIWSLGGMFDALTGTIWSEGLGQTVSKVALKSGSVLNVDYLSGCVLLIKREVIKKIGLLDEGYFFGDDDIDFCFRAQRAGYRSVLDSSAVVWHIGSYTSRHMPLQTYVERQKSDFRVILIHAPIPVLPFTFLSQLLVMPLVETLILGHTNTSMKARWQGRIFALSENLKALRSVMHTRKKAHKLGVFKPKVRIRALLGFGSTRIRSREFFMGKLLKKEQDVLMTRRL